MRKAECLKMQKISPSDAENNEYAMFDIFYTWIYDEAEKGNFDALQSILDRAGTELTPEYSEELNIEVANIREKISLEEQFRTAASAILDCNASKDFKGVYDQIEGILDSMKRYTDLGGELPYVLLDSEKSGVELNYDAGRDAAQAYIGGLIDGYLKSGQADTYYIVSKRNNGTTDGSLILLSSGTFDSYSNAIGWASGYSNLFYINATDTPTGISQTETITNHKPNVIYNLNGQKLTTPRRGINIIDGKKVIY